MKITNHILTEEEVSRLLFTGSSPEEETTRKLASFHESRKKAYSSIVSRNLGTRDLFPLFKSASYTAFRFMAKEVDHYYAPNHPITTSSHVMKLLPIMNDGRNKRPKGSAFTQPDHRPVYTPGSLTTRAQIETERVITETEYTMYDENLPLIVLGTGKVLEPTPSAYADAIMWDKVDKKNQGELDAQIKRLSEDRISVLAYIDEVIAGHEEEFAASVKKVKNNFARSLEAGLIFLTPSETKAHRETALLPVMRPIFNYMNELTNSDIEKVPSIVNDLEKLNNVQGHDFRKRVNAERSGQFKKYFDTIVLNFLSHEFANSFTNQMLSMNLFNGVYIKHECGISVRIKVQYHIKYTSIGNSAMVKEGGEDPQIVPSKSDEDIPSSVARLERVLRVDIVNPYADEGDCGVAACERAISDTESIRRKVAIDSSKARNYPTAKADWQKISKYLKAGQAKVNRGVLGLKESNMALAFVAGSRGCCSYFITLDDENQAVSKNNVFEDETLKYQSFYLVKLTEPDSVKHPRYERERRLVRQAYERALNIYKSLGNSFIFDPEHLREDAVTYHLAPVDSKRPSLLCQSISKARIKMYLTRSKMGAPKTDLARYLRFGMIPEDANKSRCDNLCERATYPEMTASTSKKLMIMSVNYSTTFRKWWVPSVFSSGSSKAVRVNLLRIPTILSSMPKYSSVEEDETTEISRRAYLTKILTHYLRKNVVWNNLKDSECPGFFDEIRRNMRSHAEIKEVISMSRMTDSHVGIWSEPSQYFPRAKYAGLSDRTVISRSSEAMNLFAASNPHYFNAEDINNTMLYKTDSANQVAQRRKEFLTMKLTNTRSSRLIVMSESSLASFNEQENDSILTIDNDINGYQNGAWENLEGATSAFNDLDYVINFINFSGTSVTQGSDKVLGELRRRMITEKLQLIKIGCFFDTVSYLVQNTLLRSRNFSLSDNSKFSEAAWNEVKNSFSHSSEAFDIDSSLRRLFLLPGVSSGTWTIITVTRNPQSSILRLLN